MDFGVICEKINLHEGVWWAMISFDKSEIGELCLTSDEIC